MPFSELTGNRFLTEYLPPGDQLQDYVKGYIVLQADFADNISRDYTLLPDVNAYLLFNIGSSFTLCYAQNKEYLNKGIILHPHDRPLALKVFPGMKLLIVQLRHGKAYRMLRSVHQLPDDICNYISDAPTVTMQLFVFRNWMLKQLSKEKRYLCSIEPALQLIGATGGDIIIRELEEGTFLTKRTLERSFIEQTGLHLKLFCRIVRFRKAMELIAQCRQPVWAKVAMECGYYDQTHFINEFRSFTGYSPGNYREGYSEFQQLITRTKLSLLYDGIA